MEGSVINIVSDGRSKVCQKWHTLCPLMQNPSHSSTRWTLDAGGWMNRRSWILSETLVVYLSPAQLLHQGAGGSGWAACVVTVCHLCRCWQVGFGTHRERHVWLSVAPCFLLWKGLPQLREALSRTVQTEHYVDVSGCFGPLHERGNHPAGRLHGQTGFTGLMRPCDEVPPVFYVFNLV